jgi:hypothetical protein
MYRTTPNKGWIYKVEDNLFIPPDELNTDYQTYLAWVKKGNKPEPWVALPPEN